MHKSQNKLVSPSVRSYVQRQPHYAVAVRLEVKIAGLGDS